MLTVNITDKSGVSYECIVSAPTTKSDPIFNFFWILETSNMVNSYRVTMSGVPMGAKEFGWSLSKWRK